MGTLSFCTGGYTSRLIRDQFRSGDRSQLARFEGRPKDLSPKARYHNILATLFPSSYRSVVRFISLQSSD